MGKVKRKVKFWVWFIIIVLLIGMLLYVFLPPIKDHVIEGDGTIKTADLDGSGASLSVANENSASAYDDSLLTHFLSVCDYETEAYSENKVRYYKTINGFYTNQFIDVENGRIVLTNYSIENDEKPVLPVCVSSETLSTANENIKRLNTLRKDSSVSIDTQMMYIFDGNKFIPVELNFITYLNELRYQDIICVNLNTGEEVPYDSFAYVE